MTPIVVVLMEKYAAISSQLGRSVFLSYRFNGFYLVLSGFI